MNPEEDARRQCKGGRTGRPRYHALKELNRQSATPEQTAGELNTSKPTVLLWAKQGIIPTVLREGRVIRFDIDQVKAALKARADKQRESEGGE